MIMAKIINLDVFKKRPFLTTGLVLVGGIIIYMLFFRGGETAQSSGQLSYTDSNVNAASGLAQQQMAMQGQAQQIQGQLSALQIQGQNDLAVAETNANLQRDLAAFAYQSTQLDNARDLMGIDAQKQVQLAGLETSEHIAALQTSSQLEALKVQAQRDVAQQQILANGQIALGNQAAAVNMAGIQAQTTLAQYSRDTQLGLASINSNERMSIAKTQGETSTTNSWIGLAGGLISLFCDRHIKSIDGCVDSERCLTAIEKMPVEFWHYIEGSEPFNNGDTTQHMNTYAQDFYRELGADDWNDRKQIAVVDYMGALSGSIKALAKDRRNV